MKQLEHRKRKTLKKVDITLSQNMMENVSEKCKPKGYFLFVTECFLKKKNGSFYLRKRWI